VSFRRRILIGFLINLLIAAGLAWWMARHELVPTGKKVMEETLVDVANLVAELVANDIDSVAGRDHIAASLQAYGQRRFRAKIYDVMKDQPDLHVYITNDRGVVIFDSQQLAVGRDYSQWHDVARTLRGEYGSRSSHVAGRLDESLDRDVHYIYVAAPIVKSGQLAGVVSVGKDAARILGYQQRAEHNVLVLLFLLAGLSTAMAILFGRSLTKKLSLLGDYAAAAAAGTASALPKLHTPELDALAAHVATMRERLEGRAYIEGYVQSLTHAMKSPLAGIAAAAEILETPLASEEREKFTQHIAMQSARLHATLDQMLKITRLEAATDLPALQLIALNPIVTAVVERFAAIAAAKNVTIQRTGSLSGVVPADKTMISEALAALLENALAHATPTSTVTVGCRQALAHAVIEISNQGATIPDYALHRIFDKFYSLPPSPSHSSDGQRSTGLGLNFVKLVAQRHRGSIAVVNRSDLGGVVATLSISIS
jgi:two-component system, OmpR family, sensor histidine kinase CreC